MKNAGDLVTIRLTQYAMDQAPGAVLTMPRHVCDLLVGRGAAEVTHDPAEPEGKQIKAGAIRNKSLSAAGA